MFELTLIRSLGIMILLATLVTFVLRRLHVPNLVTYIITGLLVFPLVEYFPMFLPKFEAGTTIVSLDVLQVITKIGIALLLFLVGLELSLEKIRDVGRVAVVAGVGQVVFTAIGGFLLSLALQFSVMESIFIAVALTFSSTVVVVKLLDQKRELHSLYGRIAVGIFLVQDLVVVIVLTFLAGLDSGEGATTLSIATNLFKAFTGMGLLLVFALVASKYLLPKPFTWASRFPEMLFIWSLGWCFLFVMLAEYFGLSLEIGAFLAGISLAQLNCSGELHRRVHPLVNFFVAVFFISLGAQMELESALEHITPAIILSLFVLIGNPLIFIWIIARMGYTEKTAFLAGVTVAQISEFSFIFAAVGLRAGFIDASILSLVALIGLITIAISAYMILHNHWLYAKIKPLGILAWFSTKNKSEQTETKDKLNNHIIVIGLNTMGKKLVEELSRQGENVLAVDTDADKLKGLPCETLLGDISYLALLEEAHYKSAKIIISTLQIEDANNLLAFRCKQVGVPTAIHAFDRSVVSELEELEVSYLIDSKVASILALKAEVTTYREV